MFTDSRIRGVVASPGKRHVVNIGTVKLRKPLSNEAFVRVKGVSMNRDELNRAKNTADNKMQMGRH